MEIELRFPKSPKTVQRVQAQKIGKKYNYSEDETNSIIKIQTINNDLRDILKIIYFWKGTSCKVDETEISCYYLSIIIDLKEKNTPSTNPEWYTLGFSEDLLDLKETLEQPNGRWRWKFDYAIDRLKEKGFIEDIEYGKKYKLDKNKFTNFIKEETKKIKFIYPDFENSKAITIIDSFPENIELKEDVEEETEEKGPEGEEWVDWFDSVKWHKEILDTFKEISQTLKKIENR